jgi:N-acetylglucosaminyldiphosphoundecaprenol N-acetyl-beta-D-mannosaminyltransferase
VWAIDLARAVQEIAVAVSHRRKGYVCVCGVHGVMEAQRDPELRSIFDRAMLVAPDGMPTVWMGWLQGLRDMRRVFGPDLMLEVCRQSVAAGHTHFLYGGNPGVAEELKVRLETMFPGIRVVGTYSPPFRELHPGEELHLAHLMSRLKPDITWIGLSTPKQEHVMARYISKLDTTLMIGVGAAFDVHTGRVRDCPGWMKPVGLQWLHRLYQEPRRLWRRYLFNNPAFVLKAALQCAGIVRYPMAYHPQTFSSEIANVANPAPNEVPAGADLQRRAS